MSETQPAYEKRSYFRRTYFINKALQSRFILGFSFAVFAGFVLNLLLVYFLIDRELSQELYKIHIKIRTTSEIAVPVLWKLSVIIIPSILAIAAAVGYYLTRRIELPLLDFKEAVRNTAQGDFTQNLSSHIPSGLPEAFNSASASLEMRFRSLKKSCDELCASYDKVERARGAAELKEAMGPVSAARKAARQEFLKFRL